MIRAPPVYEPSAIARRAMACSSVSALKTLLHSDAIEAPKDMLSWTLRLAGLATESVDAMHDAQTLLRCVSQSNNQSIARSIVFRADRATRSLLLASAQTLMYGPDELKLLRALHILDAPRDCSFCDFR